MILTESQRQQAIALMEQRGNLAAVAKELMLRPAALRSEMGADPDFSAEMTDAYEVFQGNIHNEMLKQAITNGNDKVLLRLAEAHMPEQFNAAQHKAPPTGKASSVLIRDLDAESKAAPVADTPQPSNPGLLGWTVRL